MNTICDDAKATPDNNVILAITSIIDFCCSFKLNFLLTAGVLAVLPKVNTVLGISAES